MAQNEAFGKWLKEHGHTIDSFARSIRVPYNTVLKWTQRPGIKPRYYMAERIYTSYPNCPLIVGFKPVISNIDIDSPMKQYAKKKAAKATATAADPEQITESSDETPEIE